MGCTPSSDTKDRVSGFDKQGLIVEKVGNFMDYYYLEDKLVAKPLSVVWTVRHRATGDLRAAQIIKKKLFKIHKKGLENLIERLKNLAQMDSPNLLKIHEIIEDEQKYYVITEKLHGHPLETHILNMPPGKITEKLIAGYIKQILSAISQFHFKGLPHRDIRSENIIFADEEGTLIKFVEFGLSKMEAADNISVALYTPPEIIEGKEYTLKSDIWSCGLICYFLLTGKLPYDASLNRDGVHEEIMKKEFTMDTFSVDNCKGISLEAKKFLLRLLTKDPDNRASAVELLADSWLIEAKDEELRPEVVSKYLKNLKRNSVC